MKVNYIFDEGDKKEDSYLINNNLFAVFDGFNSSMRFFDKNGKSGGLIASSIAKEIFSNNNKNLIDIAIETNQKIKEKQLDSEIDITKKMSLFGTTASVVRINSDSFEWLNAGDSVILIIYNDSSFKIFIGDYDGDKELLIEYKKLADQHKENLRDLMKEKDIQHRKEINTSSKFGGYLTGEETAIPFIQSAVESSENIKHIVLFTDGLIIPREDPSKDYDWTTFVKLFLEGGLKNVKDSVRNLENDDPNLWKYPRFKQHDDITAISISFD